MKSEEQTFKIVAHEEPLKPLKAIEKSIIKTYRSELWSKFVKAIKTYELIKPGDKIAVAISGGKDSLLLAKLFQELKKHGVDNFDLEFICMDPGFNDINRRELEANCKHLDIPVKIFDKRVFEVVDELAREYPCYMCARLRRGALYEYAQSLGCNKVALGHHYDDCIETIMMNVLCGAQYMTMMPKIKATNFDSMELIRPMYLIRERDVIRFARYNGLNPMDCGCDVAAKKLSSKRQEVKELIKELSKTFTNVEASIFNSANNVHINAILGYKDGDERISFLDNYDD